jgi:hypothetical protein
MNRRRPNTAQEPRKADNELGIRAAAATNDRDFVAFASHVGCERPFSIQAADDVSKIPRGFGRDQVANQSLQAARVQAEDDVNDREGSTCVHPGRMRLICVLLHFGCTSFVRNDQTELGLPMGLPDVRVSFFVAAG